MTDHDLVKNIDAPESDSHSKPGNETLLRKSPIGFKQWLWIIITLSCVLILYFTPVKKHLTELETIQSYIKDTGRWGPVFFLGVAASLSAIGLSRVIISTIAGITFGFNFGLLWGMLGSLIGAYGTYCYARWAGSDLIKAKWPRLKSFTNYCSDKEIFTVILLRQLPNPGFLSNLFMGVCSIKHSSFIIGSIIGYLPVSIAATLVGSSAIQTPAHTKAWYVGTILLCVIILWAVIGVYSYKSVRKSRLNIVHQ